MFLARIMAVAVDPSLIDADGRLCLERAGLAAYAHGSYFEQVGRAACRGRVELSVVAE